jgi:Tol biopolymer transport system component
MQMRKVFIVIIFVLIAQFSFGQQFTDLYGDYLGQTPPGDTPVVFAHGIISRNTLEHSAAIFSPDGNEVYWAWKDNPSAFMHIWFMKRINNRWTTPEAFIPFGDTIACLDPFLSRDGKKLYFAANINGNYDIWFVEKKGDEWGIPQSISPVINNTDYQRQPYVNSSGTMYYLGKGIERSKFENGKYWQPEILPSSINLGQGDSDPCIAPDDSYLIFSSNRKNGNKDLYISLHDTISDTWSEPINFGEPINTNSTDRFQAISPDGKYLFYTCYNGDNHMDVFWVSAKIIDRLREKSNVKK